MSPLKHLVLDLETTGLHPYSDAILEVGAIAITDELEPVAEFQQVLHCPLFAQKAADVAVQNMHSKNDLWIEAAISAHTTSTVDNLLNEWLDQWYAVDTSSIVLCGFSIHFDLSFIRAQMPMTSARVSYRLMDYGAIARFMIAAGVKIQRAESTAHRALPDCRAELALAQHMREVLRGYKE